MARYIPRADFDRNFTAATREGLRAAASTLQQKVKAEKLSGSPLGVRAGHLRQSITYVIEQTPGVARALVGTNVRYARIHEFGGTITSKKGKYLAIPIGAALTGAGAMRGAFSGIMEGAPTSLRNIPGLIFVPRKGRPPLLCVKGGRGSLKPVFVLKRSVHMPQRSFLRPALYENVPALSAAFARGFKSTMLKGASRVVEAPSAGV